MILIYTENITSRLKYTFNLIFIDILGVKTSFTNNINEFNASEKPKLNYSKQQINNELFIYAHDLLFETGITNVEDSVFDYMNQKSMFPSNNSSIIPFDPFASAFYIVTRYEEYQQLQNKDKFNRYAFHNSIAYKHHFIDKPVVNLWAKLLFDKIKLTYPDISYTKRTYKFISTIDIDNAYAYKHKGFIRTIAGLTKSVFINPIETISRLKTIFRTEKDIYDTYIYIEQTHQKYNIKPIFFFLLGKYSKYDKNISPDNIHFKNLIKSLSDKSEIGLHPSFLSNENYNNLMYEHKTLSSIINKKVNKSRQHFLRLKFPDTYNNLLKLTIQEDYTMGYPEVCGFRAGICTPYNYYNLVDEKETNLKIFPFQIMDLSLNKYMNLSTNEAIKYIESIISSIKEVNGTFISIWHNESLSDAGRWKNWRTVYEKMLETASK